MGEMQGYVDADYLRRAAQRGRQFKQRSYELMGLQPGYHVLDVGCGPGVDTIPMAALVGESGRVVGLDVDKAMVEEAESLVRARGLTDCVAHRVGAADALPFADAAFDAIRAERLLQVLPARSIGERAVQEMHRVLRPGGRVALVDADWGSASVDFSDSRIERRLLTFFAELLRPNGYAGRELPRLLRRHSFTMLDVEVVAAVHPDLSLLPFDRWLPEEAEKAGVISKTEADLWRDELHSRVAEGSFFATVNMVIATGGK